MPTPIWVPVADLQSLRSSEATYLLCRSGHVIGHPWVCPDGCVHVSGALVRDVLPCKDPGQVRAVQSSLCTLDYAQTPLHVEDGWLIDGHHRVAAAVALGLRTLPVEQVDGVLARQQQWHRRVLASGLAGVRVSLP